VAAPLLPRFRLVDEPAERNQRVTVAIRESEHSSHTPIGGADGDARQLRGIPAVSRSGIGSAMPGTQPEAALLAKQED
jgi:hypothetical protein